MIAAGVLAVASPSLRFMPVEFLADDEVAVTFRAVLLTGAG